MATRPRRVFEAAPRQNTGVIRRAPAALVLPLLLACAAEPAPRPAAESAATAAPVSAPAQDPPVDLFPLVDPFVGTDGTGHTFPGASVPWGMVQLSPDTRTQGWDACSGYHASHRTILGFSHTHLSGTGIGDLGDVLLVPTTGLLQLDPGPEEDPASGYRSAFRAGTERAAPGWYRVLLEDHGIDAEVTATERCGMHSYRFLPGSKPNVLIDLRHGIQDQTLEASAEIIGDREITGFRRSRGWAADQTVFFVARFSEPVRESGLRVDGEVREGAREGRGRDVVAFARFDRPEDGRLLVKVGISFRSVEGARRNLDAEIAGFDFDGVRARAEARWREALSPVEVRGGSEHDARVLATALYHAFLAPCLASDVGEPDDFHVFSLWDTFRALHPLLSLVAPERNSAFVASMLRWHERTGRLPVWSLAGNETDCMIGYHAIPVIADAWAKGDRSFDGDRALDAMLASARGDLAGLRWYRELGYVPSDRENESVSKTLEYAYDDACIARMARDLGREDVAAEFARRAKGWAHLLDPETGFFRARRNGDWLEPFDPREVSAAYTEANAWQYSFFAPHDVESLMAAHGGPEPFTARLDALFAEPSETTGCEQLDITGRIGQYAHGNEPSHAVAFLYAYAGRPDRVAERVAAIRRLYGTGRDGLCGNDDCGQMSAWHVLAALGLYAPDPAEPTWLIGTPLFPEARVRLGGGRTLVIRAEGVSEKNVHVRSATWNGKAITRAWLAHAEIAGGGTLALTMGDAPSDWGTRPEDRPRSAIGVEITPNPRIVSAERVFVGSTEAALRSDLPGATIRSTLDGTVPTDASPVYEGPIRIERSLRLRAVAHAPGREPSFAEEAAFAWLPAHRSVSYAHAYAPQYSGGGRLALLDAQRGEPSSFARWQGFEGVPFEAVVDLGESRALARVAAGFLQDTRSWIWLPTSVEFALSDDGREFRSLGTIPCDVDEETVGPLVRDVAADAGGARARFVRIVATSRGTCPPWHPGAGSKCWVFVDEVIAE